jgi:K+-sensing histidine kinase KdpD
MASERRSALAGKNEGMTMRGAWTTNRGVLWRWVLCVLLMALILAFDLAIPLGVAMGVPYVAVILLSLWLPGRATIVMAVLCSVLTFGAYFYKPTVPELWKGLFNRYLAVLAIWATAGLGLQRKQAVEKYAEALHEREKALDELRILRGLLPICAYCKKIRNDQGAWIQMEQYIRDHSEAEFSHGICPRCLKGLYPELANRPSARTP